jgi:dUTP pyrophosphatase
MKINFTKTSDFAICPQRSTPTDAGFDLFSIETCVIKPLERKLVNTGIKIEIPDGYYGRIAPRSGLAFKKGIDVMAGVIDSGYRGELKVLLINLCQPSNPKGAISSYESFFGPLDKFSVSQGERIAQLIIEKCYDADWEEKEALSESKRNEGGFGSSGA